MGLAVVTLKKGEGRFLKSGGMWVFDNEIASVMGSFVNGDIVLVHDFDGYPLGRGFINRNSKITVRLLTRNENQKIDEDFFEKRVRDAWEYRKKVTDTSSCRVIFGEADFFPGLVVDKFEDVLVVQSLALGIDRWKELILDLIKKILAEDGIMIVVLTLEKHSSRLLAGPDIVSRGFVYVRESEDLMDEARIVVEDAIDVCLDKHITDWGKIKNIIKDSLGDFLWKRTKRNPMILPIIMEA